MNRCRIFASALLLATPLAFSQNPGNQNQAPMQPPGQPGMNRPMVEGRGMGRGMGSGMHILPPGTWWKNPSTATLLALTPEQQKRMDDIFLQSRLQLIQLKASLEEEQVKLEPLLNNNPPDEGRALAQISKIADLRADLEKADARMLLSLRSVLTADQWTKLQTERRNRHSNPDGADGFRGGRGPGGVSGPNAQGAPHDPQGPPPSSFGNGGDNLDPGV